MAKHSKQSYIAWCDLTDSYCYVIYFTLFAFNQNQLTSFRIKKKSKNQNQNPIKMDYERIQKPQVLAYSFMHFWIHWICCPFYLKRCRLGCARRRIFPRKVKEYAFGSRKEEKRRWWFWIQISTYSCSWIIIRYIFLLFFFFGIF